MHLSSTRSYQTRPAALEDMQQNLRIIHPTKQSFEWNAMNAEYPDPKKARLLFQTSAE